MTLTNVQNDTMQMHITKLACQDNILSVDETQQNILESQTSSTYRLLIRSNGDFKSKTLEISS